MLLVVVNPWLVEKVWRCWSIQWVTWMVCGHLSFHRSRPLKRAMSFHEFPGPSCNGSWFEVPLNPWKWEEFWFTAPALWMCKRTSMCQGHSRARKAKIRNWCTLVIWGVPSWKKPFQVLLNEKPSTCQATPKLTSQSMNEHCPMFFFFCRSRTCLTSGNVLTLTFSHLFSVWLFVCLAIKPGSRACIFLSPRFGLPGTEKMRTPQGCLRCWPQMSDTQAMRFALALWFACFSETTWWMRWYMIYYNLNPDDQI